MVLSDSSRRNWRSCFAIFGSKSATAVSDPSTKSRSEADLTRKEIDSFGIASLPFKAAFIVRRKSENVNGKSECTCPCNKMHDTLTQSISSKGFNAAEIKERWRNPQIRAQLSNKKKSFWSGIPILFRS